MDLKISKKPLTQERENLRNETALKISKKLPEFMKSHGGHPIKECIVVEFPNCISTKTDKSFEWMPTYQQLIDIKKALDEIEPISWGKEKPI